MKRYLLVCILLGASAFLKGQSEEAPTEGLVVPDWQIGIVGSDVAVPALTVDGSIQISGIHHLGLRFSRRFYQSFNSRSLYQRTNWAYQGGLYHKMFVPVSDQDMIVVRHGARFGVSEFEFDAMAWDSYQEYGNTFLEYREITLQDQPITMGYEVTLGIQSYTKIIYFEAYFGFAYQTIINKPELLVQEYKSDYDLGLLSPGSEFDYNFRPVVGLVIGFSKNY